MTILIVMMDTYDVDIEPWKHCAMVLIIGIMVALQRDDYITASKAYINSADIHIIK